MKYFTYEELIYSETALKKRMRNKTTKAVEENLAKLVEIILDPLRERYGKPIYVNSGYRSKEVNKAIGGVPTSQHLTGCAADITVNSKSGNRDLARLIVDMGLPFGQVIDEKDYAWVHVSWDKDRISPRRQLLRFNGKTYKVITKEEL